MQARGETLAAIAELAGVKASDVRMVLKSAGAQSVAALDALGAPSGADDTAGGAPLNGAAAADGTPQALGVGGHA